MARVEIDVRLGSTRLAAAHRAVRQGLQTPFDLSELRLEGRDPAAVELARRFWARRMEAEHRSVQVFTQLALQLIEVNAPFDAKTVTLRMAEDELLHTEFSAEVLGALGAPPRIRTDPGFAPLARHPGCSPEERVLRNVLYTTCLSEMVAVARLGASHEQSSDPGIRSAIRSLLSDEVMHGQFGFHYLDAMQPSAELRANLEKYLVHAFAVLEEELCGRSAGQAPIDADAVDLGVVDPAAADEVFRVSVEEAIVPGLEARGLAAGRAWRKRRLLA